MQFRHCFRIAIGKNPVDETVGDLRVGEKKKGANEKPRIRETSTVLRRGGADGSDIAVSGSIRSFLPSHSLTHSLTVVRTSVPW